MDNMDNQSDSARGGGIVTARGTGDGLVLRLDSRVDQQNLLGAVSEFMNTRKSFLSGNNVTLEWVGGKPEGYLVDQLSKLLKDDFSINVKDSRQKDKRESLSSSIEVISDEILSDDFDFGMSASSSTSDMKRQSSGLFSGISGISTDTQTDIPMVSVSNPRKDSKKAEASVPMAWDDADARIIYATLRSGQKIETEHSLIIVGDINPGAEVVAGGDIIILGSLRGTAHAGAYDETGAGRVIFGLNLQPTQLRIGMVISRGCSSPSKVPEVARVEGDIIIVEPFNGKMPCFNRGS